jgi:hypothetical protein
MKPIIDEQIKAMFQASLIRGIDVVFMLIYLLGLAGTAGWVIFGQFNRDVLMLVLVLTGLLTQAWLVLLAFRVGFIALQCRADIKLMPEAAARMALLYQQGAPSKPQR